MVVGGKRGCFKGMWLIMWFWDNWFFGWWMSVNKGYKVEEFGYSKYGKYVIVFLYLICCLFFGVFWSVDVGWLVGWLVNFLFCWFCCSNCVVFVSVSLDGCVVDFRF